VALPVQGIPVPSQADAATHSHDAVVRRHGRMVEMQRGAADQCDAGAIATAAVAGDRAVGDGQVPTTYTPAPL
jgi:hypothetical protein